MISTKIILWVVGGIFSLLLVADLVYLNMQALKPVPIPFQSSLSLTPQSGSPTQKLPTPSPSNTCSTACVALIQEATKTAQVAQLPQPTPITIIKEVKEIVSSSSQTSSAKEFFIPLGSGTTTSQEWKTLTGLGAKIDPANYQGITSVYFEASLRIPTANGRLYARLINITDNTPMEETSVYVEGTVGQLVSSLFSLRSGEKTYGVQLRSTLGFDGILDLARIKIVTK